MSGYAKSTVDRANIVNSIAGRKPTADEAEILWRKLGVYPKVQNSQRVRQSVAALPERRLAAAAAKAAKAEAKAAKAEAKAARALARASKPKKTKKTAAPLSSMDLLGDIPGFGVRRMGRY